MLNIVLFGAPGTGKGTQSGLIMEKYRLIHLSTGDMMRKAIADSTPVGAEAKKYIDKGALVPDDIILETVHMEMMKWKSGAGFVFDGFPRTLVQAEALDNMLRDLGMPISLVFYLEVDEAELFKRIIHRSKISARSDDNEETIQKRINVYQDQTLPLLEYYRKQGKCKDIDGMKGIEEVFAHICENIDYYKETHH
jgi:adenylate kinase